MSEVAKRAVIERRDARMPARPTIPMTLWGLVATIAAERMVLCYGMAPKENSTAFLVGALVALGAVGVPLALFRGAMRGGKQVPQVPAAFAFVATTALAGALLGWLALGRVLDAAQSLSTTPVSAWELQVEGDMTEGGHGWWGRARARGSEGTEVGMVWLSSSVELECGSRVRCVGRFEPNGDDEWGISSRMQGIAGTVSVIRVTSVRGAEGPLGTVLCMRRAVLASFSPYSCDAAAVLAGSVCGNRAPIRSRGLDGAFSTCGVSHLVAVSGGHLAILTGALAAMLDRSRLKPGMRGTLTLGVGALFIAFCGAPVSAVRAGIMNCISFGGTLVGRRSHALSSTCAAALVMALLDPFASGQLGFLLSIASVVGICLFGSHSSHVLDVLTRSSRHHRGRTPGITRALGRLRSDSCDVLGVSLVAQLFTLPLTCSVFGEVSLIAPLANLMLAPLFAGLVSLGLGAALLTPLPALQAPALGAAKEVSAVFCTLLSALARLPLACIPVEVGGIVLPAVLCALWVALYVVWPVPRRRHLAGAVAVLVTVASVALLGLRFLQPTRVTVLDVGQGDAILVADGGAAVLIDAGPDEVVAQELARQGIIHLDAIVLTHLHDDHVGGIDDLAGRVGCERVLVAQGVADNMPASLGESVIKLTGHDAEELSYGDSILVGSFLLRVVSPVGEVTGNDNADSVMLSLSCEWGGRTLSALLTGDAEKDETGACLARGDVGDIDFLKVGHHGSEISVTVDEAARLDPEVSVASAGEGNRYGHPRAECVDALEGAGSLFLCTKDVGCVTVRPGVEGPIVSTERPLGREAGEALVSGL